MFIAIDGNEANVKNRVGSNEYAFQILKNIWKTQLPFRVGVGTAGTAFKFKVYLKNAPLADLPKETNWWKYKVLKPEFLWTQWRLPLELFLTKEKPDVFFTPGHYSPRFCPIPLVISIMDLAFLRYPEQFLQKDLWQLKKWTALSVKKANKIFAISQSTKNDIIKFYGVKPDKIVVTYPGVKMSKVKSQKSKVKGKYFIYIGTLQPRKNVIRLIEAFSSTINHQPSTINHLVIVGKKGWLYDDIFEKVKALGLEKNVIFTGFISEKEKNSLLQNAFAFILPSLYEGFGFPVLEAMKVGCPVIVSKVSSLPEVAGGACIYIDNPKSVDSIYKAMLKMIKLRDKERKELINKGYQQVKKFSWRKTAEKTLSVLEKLGG